MEKYIIYTHINRINGKLYIGKTKNDIYSRSQNGNGYNNCPVFSKAISKYGWDNFEHITIMEGLSPEEASVIEEELIRKYHTNESEFGYNTNIGNKPGIPYKRNSTKHGYGTTEKIRQVLKMVGLTQNELSNKLGIEQPTLSKKFKLDNWKESDLGKISNVCDCEFEGHFILEDGEII